MVRDVRRNKVRVIKSLLRQGLTLADLGKKLGVSKQAVHRAIHPLPRKGA